VPFIIYNPNLFKKGISIDNYTTLLDILPTTLDLMEIPYGQDRFDGISQKEVIETSELPNNSKRLIVSETNFHYGKKGMMRSCAIWEDRWKLIHNKERESKQLKGQLPIIELYDLHEDLNETNNLFDERRDVVEKIFLLLTDWKKGNTLKLQKKQISEDFLEGNIDPEITEQLKALGYIK
jgi:arylsulfatase A-like enzyme